MSVETGWIVIRVQLEGSGPWETVYYSDMVRKSTREGAIRYGWRALGHDDFLIGEVRDNVLLRMAWQHEDREAIDPDGWREERADAAEHLCLEVPS